MKLLKQTILTLLIVTTTHSGYTQDGFLAKTKGTFLANGSIFLFNTTRNLNDDKASTFEINFAPRAAYFIADNISVGLEFFIQSNKETQEDEIFGDIENKTSGIFIGPFGRYYFKNNLFAEALVGFGSQNIKSSGGIIGGTDENKSTSFGFRIGAGYTFFLGEHVAIEPTINYSRESFKPENAPSDFKDTLSSIFLGIGISAYF